MREHADTLKGERLITVNRLSDIGYEKACIR